MLAGGARRDGLHPGSGAQFVEAGTFLDLKSSWMPIRTSIRAAHEL